jgi:protein-disulfide isomerase
VSTAEGDEQDLTRKQRREQAREKRKELEDAQAASAVRRTRLIQLGIVGVIVVAIIIGIVVATSGGKKNEGLKSETGPGGPRAQLIAAVGGLLGGIPESGSTLGTPSAPVTLQYFGDLQCPVCKQFTLGALKPLIENDVRAGKLKIEYRGLETATREPETFKTQQVAALAAGKQQKAWYYIELFYHQQGEEHSGYVNENFLQEIAKQVPGLNVSKWQSDRSSSEFATELQGDAQASNTFGFTGTPSFAIGKTGGTAQKLEAESFTDPSSFEAAVRRFGG